jgi:hypothetical protein
MARTFVMQTTEDNGTHIYEKVGSMWTVPKSRQSLCQGVTLSLGEETRRVSTEDRGLCGKCAAIYADR